MKQKIKIAVIGGTGKSGKYLVKALLQEGFPIKILLRNPASFQINNPLVEVIIGDARDYASIQVLVKDCQAVISTLGQPKGENSAVPQYSQVTKHVIQAMQESGIKRYITTTGMNVDTPLDTKSEKTKFATEWMKTNYPITTLDKQVEWEVLSASNVDWTLVRLPLIEQTEQRAEVLVSLQDCLGDKISATDLAYFLIDQLSDSSYNKKAPFIANT